MYQPQSLRSYIFDQLPSMHSFCGMLFYSLVVYGFILLIRLFKTRVLFPQMYHNIHQEVSRVVLEKRKEKSIAAKKLAEKVGQD